MPIVGEEVSTSLCIPRVVWSPSKGRCTPEIEGKRYQSFCIPELICRWHLAAKHLHITRRHLHLSHTSSVSYDLIRLRSLPLLVGVSLPQSTGSINPSMSNSAQLLVVPSPSIRVHGSQLSNLLLFSLIRCIKATTASSLLTFAIMSFNNLR
jgi:hypothetical protein